MDKWSTLKLFITAADCGSFTSAARQHGTDPSTISKAVKRLEDEIGIKLFERTTRHLTLTEAGGKYLNTAREACETLAQTESEIREAGTKPQGRLRINAPVSYGRRYIVLAAESFGRQYPDIKLELHFNDAYVDIVEAGFDLAIRTGSLQDRRLIARKLSPMDFLVCASPDFLGRLPAQFSASSSLTSLPWVRFRFKQTGKLMPLLIAKGERIEEMDGDESYIVDDGEAAVALCAAGLGLVQLPHFAVRKELEEGSLILLLPACGQDRYGVYMVYPDRRYLPQKTKLFMAHLQDYVESVGEGPEMAWQGQISPVLAWG